MTAAASATPPHGSPRLPIKLQHGSAVAPRQKHKTRLAAGAVSIQNPPRGGFWGIRDHAKARLLDLAFLVRHMLAQVRVRLSVFHHRRGVLLVLVGGVVMADRNSFVSGTGGVV